MKRQATVQQVTWFLDLHRTNQLDLEPPYQRKSVWSPKDRRFFLDTIFRNYPCPPIFVHKTITDEGFTVYHVVDGKQRLETVLQFAQNLITLDKQFGDTTLNGKNFSELSTDQKRIFWDYVFGVEFLDIADNADVNKVFDRVNRNQRNLKPQELRHARHSGWFISDVEEESEDSFWESFKITTKARSKRMDNVQFVSELMLIILDKKIMGFSQEYLDEKTALYEDIEDEDLDIDTDDYKKRRQEIKDFINEMEKCNGAILKHAKTQGDFYSLWALICLWFEFLPKPVNEFAERYASFMARVKQIRDNSISPEEISKLKFESIYADNLRGASTDLRQRDLRLTALKDYLIG